MNPKYQLNTEENIQYLKELCESLLRFGHKFPSPDGSAYYLGDDGTPWTDRSRETYATARMAHVYSIGSFLGHEGSEALTDAALKGLKGALRDNTHGGWFSGLDADSAPLSGKLCYAHAFVILAATSGILSGRPGAQAYWITFQHLRHVQTYRHFQIAQGTIAKDLISFLLQ